MEGLPETNWLRRNPDLVSLDPGDDAGLFDLLLHSQDRAYTVPEVAKFVGDARLTLVSFIEPGRYDPLMYLQDKTLRGPRREARLAHRRKPCRKPVRQPQDPRLLRGERQNQGAGPGAALASRRAHYDRQRRARLGA